MPVKRDNPRRLLCNCSLMCGACAFDSSCHFIHDRRVISKELGSGCKPRATPLKSNLRDSFFWPDQQLPEKDQHVYEIPENFSCSQSHSHLSAHNRGLYSLWGHFIDMLVDPHSYLKPSRNSEENIFLPKRSRLPTFVRLAQGEEFPLEKKAIHSLHLLCGRSEQRLTKGMAMHPKRERESC
jgi:hypothetical protein